MNSDSQMTNSGNIINLYSQVQSVLHCRKWEKNRRVQRSVTLSCRLETLECKHHARGNEITVGNTHTHTHTDARSVEREWHQSVCSLSMCLAINILKGRRMKEVSQDTLSLSLSCTDSFWNRILRGPFTGRVLALQNS